MTVWLLAPLLLQALAMLIDELYFHRQRGLPLWERVGHPLDTLSVLACYVFALAVTPTSAALAGFVALAAFSCLLVTKDELVHAQRCRPAEQWLHSLLFVLHPVVLGVAALLWQRQERALLWCSAALTLGFGLHQALYWNVPWKKLVHRSSPSITISTTSSASAGTAPTTIRSRSCGPNPASEIHG